MSAQKSNNKILILGVLMLGAYMVMRPRGTVYAATANQGRPVTMPQSVGSGLAQSAVGAFASYLSGLVGGKNESAEARYANEVMKSPYLLADHLVPQESINDILSPDNWSGGTEYLA